MIYISLEFCSLVQNGLSDQWYMLSINKIKNITTSCDGSTCYCAVNLRTTSVPPPYAVEVATISNGQIGPYSLPVESVGKYSIMQKPFLKWCQAFDFSKSNIHLCKIIHMYLLSYKYFLLEPFLLIIYPRKAHKVL